MAPLQLLVVLVKQIIPLDLVIVKMERVLMIYLAAELTVHPHMAVPTNAKYLIKMLKVIAMAEFVKMTLEVAKHPILPKQVIAMERVVMSAHARQVTLSVLIIVLITPLIASINIIMRPTNIVIWFYMALIYLATVDFRARILVAFDAVLIGYFLFIFFLLYTVD